MDAAGTAGRGFSCGLKLFFLTKVVSIFSPAGDAEYKKEEQPK